MTEQEIIEAFKAMMEKSTRWGARYGKLSRFKGRQDALISLLHQMIEYRSTSYRKTIDVDAVMEMLEKSLYENQEDTNNFIDEMKGRGKVLYLDENNRWGYGS